MPIKTLTAFEFQAKKFQAGATFAIVVKRDEDKVKLTAKF